MPDYKTLHDQFAAAGQSHVFAFWDRLSESERATLLSQAAEVDLAEIALLNSTLVKGNAAAINLEGLEPAPFVRHPKHGGDANTWQEAKARGEAALRAGRVAAFVVAGGQGTRLGYDGPKGTYPVTPIRKKSLFQVFAEKILAASRRCGKTIPWFIMTSHQNNAATVAFFEENGYFGLAKESVHFFTQGRMPAVSFDGKILMETTSTLALSPDGHGGSLRALVRSGAVAKMRALGIDTLTYFQVDNPLVQCIDPTFIGFHLASGAELSSKMIPKAYPLEKLGHFCVQNGRNVVIEYSDLPKEMQEERLQNGELRFLAGSIAIHILGVDFIERVGRGDAAYALPFHRADKKIKTIQSDGSPLNPEKPNGIKFEMFVFDALPFAKNPVVIETLREDDFSPVKNAEGLDSPLTCKNDQLRQWARWLKAAGSPLPCDDSGLPSITFEISPLFAESESVFVEKWKQAGGRLQMVDGGYLER